MIQLVHAPVLLALMALQFHAGALDEPAPVWRWVSRALTVLGIVAAPLSFYAGGLVGGRAAIAALIVAAAGIARHRNFEPATRWFRWLELGSWCLTIIAVCGMISVLITRSLL